MTFSIVARDPATGDFGVATATGGPAVGSLVPHARSGTGAIATQASTNPHWGRQGLDLLETSDAQTTLDRLVSADPGRDVRQLLVIDRAGRTAVWTGRDCALHAEAVARTDVAVGGNILANLDVLPAMLEGFAAPGKLEDRLLAALAAGHQAGGDARGASSAALKVYTGEPFPMVDLRVDHAADPIAALTALLAVSREPAHQQFMSRLPKDAPG